MKFNNSNISFIDVSDKSESVTVKGGYEWRDIVDAFVRSLDVRVSSRCSYRKAVSIFFRYIESTGRNVSLLSRADIIAFKEHLLSDSHRHSELTVALYLCAVRQFYAWAEGEKLYPNIARGVKSPRRRNGSFKKMHMDETQGEDYLEHFLHENEREYVRRFRNVNGMSLRDYAAVTVMLYCGLRTIEVIRLNIEDITFRSGKRVLMVHGKGRDAKDAYVVLIDEAWEPVSRYLSTRRGALPGEPLFACEGYGSKGRRMSTRRLQAVCKEGFRSIGLDGHEYSAHSLRHTCGVMIVRHGGQLLDVQAVLRHRSPVTSQIYIESAMEELRLQNAPENRLAGCFRK